ATHARESSVCQRPRFAPATKSIHALFIARPPYRQEPVAPAPQPKASGSAHERRESRRAPREGSMLNCAHLENRRTGTAASPPNLAPYAIYSTPHPPPPLPPF